MAKTPKTIKIRSKYRGRCLMCDDLYQPGEAVLWAKGLGCMHVPCYSPGMLSGYMRGFSTGYRSGLRDSHGDTTKTTPLVKELKAEATAEEKTGTKARLFTIVESLPMEAIEQPPSELAEEVPMGKEYIDSLLED